VVRLHSDRFNRDALLRRASAFISVIRAHARGQLAGVSCRLLSASEHSLVPCRHPSANLHINAVTAAVVARRAQIKGRARLPLPPESYECQSTTRIAARLSPSACTRAHFVDYESVRQVGKDRIYIYAD